MTALALARSWRPKTFSQLVGQDHVVKALTHALDQRRLHHAWLFTGTRGVGKTTIARIMAKALNCVGEDGQGKMTSEPCGKCPACLAIDAGRFVDYIEMDAASNRGVDDIAALLEKAAYAPSNARYKVYMIDEVHMLTNTAFNAMLKTLEEPPEYLKFVLATTDPQKVPVTVLSRCLQFNLRPMAPETVLEHLAHVLAQENIPAEPQALRLLARAARGSMRDALSLTDQAIAYGSGQLQEASVRQMLGSADRSHVFRLIEALAQGDGKTVVDTSEALRLNGISAAATMEEMSMVLQRMAVLQAVPDMAEPDADPEATELARLADVMPPDETQLLYSLCLHGRQELGLAPDEYAALTMVLLRLLAFKPQAHNASATAEKKSLNETRAHNLAPAKSALPAQPALRPSAPAPQAAPAVEAKQAPPIQTLPVREMTPPRSEHTHSPAQNSRFEQDSDHDSDAAVVAMPVREQAPVSAKYEAAAPTQIEVVHTPEGDFWFALVQQMAQAETINALVRELALQSQLIARDSDTWMLRVERESLNTMTSRERLQAALAQAGHAVRLMVELGNVQDSPSKRHAAAAAARQQQAQDTILNDAYVQSLMRDFCAKIVPGSIKAI